MDFRNIRYLLITFELLSEERKLVQVFNNVYFLFLYIYILTTFRSGDPFINEKVNWDNILKMSLISLNYLVTDIFSESRI